MMVDGKIQPVHLLVSNIGEDDFILDTLGSPPITQILIGRTPKFILKSRNIPIQTRVLALEQKYALPLKYKTSPPTTQLNISCNRNKKGYCILPDEQPNQPP